MTNATEKRGDMEDADDTEKVDEASPDNSLSQDNKTSEAGKDVYKRQDKEHLHYLEQLSEMYPTIGKASSEIINLQAILNLPKGSGQSHNSTPPRSFLFVEISYKSCIHFTVQRGDMCIKQSQNERSRRYYICLLYTSGNRIEARARTSG